MRIDPNEGVLADDASASPPSEDVNAAVMDQADDTTLSESDAVTSDDDAPDSGGSDEVIDDSDAPDEAKEWVKRTNKTVQRRLREAAEEKLDRENITPDQPEPPEKGENIG